MSKTAPGEWLRLDGQRQGYLTRAQRYSGYTLTRVCPPDNYDANNDELQSDWQAVGAQVVNHLSNRLMLTMYAPSRPFIRLEVGDKEKQQLLSIGAKESEITAIMAASEQKAVRELDTRAVRPLLHESLVNLIVVGDCAAYMDDDAKVFEVFGIRDYVLQRSPKGHVLQAIVRESYAFSDLEKDAQAEVLKKHPTIKADTVVCQYRWVKREDNRITQCVWIDDLELPDSFSSSWAIDDSPWKFWAWNLRRKQHYGTGLVEEYKGDFAALSALSKAQVESAILASEFRWLVNPAGNTNIDDFEQSENGAALAGVEGDVSLVANSKPGDLQIIRTINEDYVRRIGRGFLLGSAMTRDAERVTAQEIQAQAQELETGLGGAYSRLASTQQYDVGRWLLVKADVSIKGTSVRLAVITGLDALSRNGDLAALRGALTDIAGLGNLGEAAQALDIGEIMSAIFVGWGLPAAKFVKKPEQVQAEQQAKQDAEVNAQSSIEGAKAGAQSAVQPPAQ